MSPSTRGSPRRSCDERRGRPAAHVVAAARHRGAGAHGSAERFGENLAVLLGCLVLLVAVLAVRLASRTGLPVLLLYLALG